MTIFFIVLGVLGLVAYAVVPNWTRSTTEDRLREWARGRGYEIITMHIASHSERTAFQNRYTAPGQVVYVPGRAEVRLRHVMRDVEIQGRLVWDSGMTGIKNIDFIESRVFSSDEPAVSALIVGGDTEAQVLAEVNRRLDGITSQPNWMEPYDLDGSGHVDEEEWSILRGDIMAQVRGEIGDPGVRSVSTPEEGAKPVRRLPAPVVNDDDDGVLW